MRARLKVLIGVTALPPDVRDVSAPPSRAGFDGLRPFGFAHFYLPARFRLMS